MKFKLICKLMSTFLIVLILKIFAQSSKIPEENLLFEMLFTVYCKVHLWFSKKFHKICYIEIVCCYKKKYFTEMLTSSMVAIRMEIMHTEC